MRGSSLSNAGETDDRDPAFCFAAVSETFVLVSCALTVGSSEAWPHAISARMAIIANEGIKYFFIIMFL